MYGLDSITYNNKSLYNIANRKKKKRSFKLYDRKCEFTMWVLETRY